MLQLLLLLALCAHWENWHSRLVSHHHPHSHSCLHKPHPQVASGFKVMSIGRVIAIIVMLIIVNVDIGIKCNPRHHTIFELRFRIQSTHRQASPSSASPPSKMKKSTIWRLSTQFRGL